MMNKSNLGRITESRTDANWGRPAAPVRNVSWFDERTYTGAQLSLGPSTDREWYAYDATALTVRGHCAYEPIRTALAVEHLTPIKTADGRAIASIWFNILRDSVCGAYHEIVISIDATPDGEHAEVRFTASGNPFCYLYNNFAPNVCRRQFLHSLYINSPLSIAWGREMQGFPKHPVPADTRLEDGTASFEAAVQWGSDPIIRTVIGKRWGIGALLRQGLGLMTSVSPLRLTRFLIATQLDMAIQMPQSTVDRYEVPPTYTTYIRKGRNLTSIRCWPWSTHDFLDLGDVQKPTGCEEHNGHVLLQEAEYTPTIVTYLPFMQAYVGAHDEPGCSPGQT